MKSLNWPHYR